MSIRGYGMACTGVLGSIFGFDLVWNLTQMDAIEAAFTALIIGIFAAFAFVLITEPKPSRKAGPEYEFRTDDTGLSVLVRRDA